jgi:uncharacterized protein Smg (DUF494 family)
VRVELKYLSRYNKNMKKERTLSKSQEELNTSLKNFYQNNKEISKALKLFEMSNERYRKAIKPNIRISTSTGTKFKSFTSD